MEVNFIRVRLKKMMDALCEYLLEEGVTIAKAQLVAMQSGKGGYNVEGGPLYNSIQRGVFDKQKRVGYITAGEGLTTKSGLSYAVYVEYGTGDKVKPASSQTNTSPGTSLFKPKLNLPVKTAPAKSEQRWVYFNERDNKFYTTSGQAPKPFMRTTLNILTGNVFRESSRFIAEYLPREGA